MAFEPSVQDAVRYILEFFAMDRADQEAYLPPVDDEPKYVLSDTGAKTPYPAQYFCHTSVVCLGRIHFGPERDPEGLMAEIEDLLCLMTEFSSTSKYPTMYGYMWSLEDPNVAGAISGPANIFWAVLRRLSRQFLKSEGVHDRTLPPFETLREVFPRWSNMVLTLFA